MTALWRHKDVWTLPGKDFIVQVHRHSVEQRPSYYGDTGPHRWCVYAFIYPKHPHFARFSGGAMWQDAATALPLHGGPSLLNWHFDNDKAACSVQVGADYNHLHDDCYTHMETREDAREVFSDAEGLHEWLTRAATVEAEAAA